MSEKSHGTPGAEEEEVTRLIILLTLIEWPLMLLISGFVLVFAGILGMPAGEAILFCLLASFPLTLKLVPATPEEIEKRKRS